MMPWLLCWTALISFFVMWPASSVRAQEPFVVTRSTGLYFAPPECTVVLRDGAGYQERWAAHEFVAYVQRADEGRTLLPLAYGSVPEGWAGSAIVVGVAGEPPFSEVDAKLMPLHGFTIRTEPGRLVVIGQSEQGASNALYWLLDAKLGVRWYMPTRLGEEVPVHKGITIPAMNETLGPDIPVTTVDARYYGTKGNRTSRGQARDDTTRHIWDVTVPPTEENKRDHPDWFALTDRKEMPTEQWMLEFIWKDAGGRIRSQQVCTTHPDVIQMFIADAKRYFRENPDIRMYSVSPNDYHDFCTCDRCVALDRELGNGPLTNRLVYFFNQIAEGIKGEFPDKYLGFTAYSSHVDPPTTVKPDPMIWASLCFFGGRACYQHAIDDAACPINRAWKATVFDGWAKLCDSFGYYSYYGYSGKWMGPQLLTRHIARDLRLMRDHGGTRFHVDGWSNWATNAPMNYLIRRIAWDVDADPDAILEEWYRGVYGPAYEPMKRYWSTLTQGRYQVEHDGSVPDHPHKMFTRDILNEARVQLEQAEAAVASADDRYQRRVAIARAGYEFTEVMATAHVLAAEGKYPQAIAAGRRAIQVIRDTRKVEPVSYVTPLFPRDEQAWVWYRSWDGKITAESMTEDVIKRWEREAAGKSDAMAQYGEVLLTLPEVWEFQKDENNVGVREQWPRDRAPADAWRSISTHAPWTSQEFPGRWHGVGWYRLKLPLDAPAEGKLYLYFGAVDGYASVWVNGMDVGRQDKPPQIMWNKPFALDISRAVKRKGDNTIIVRVQKNDHAAGIHMPTEIRVARP